MSKVVLLCYQERKKKIAIAAETAPNELEYVKGEFLKSFSLLKSVKTHQITLQRFDPEWDEYVDVDEGEVLQNKDKLKVLVSPCVLDAVSESAVVPVASCEDQRLGAGEVTHVEVSFGLKCTFCDSMQIDVLQITVRY